MINLLTVVIFFSNIIFCQVFFIHDQKQFYSTLCKGHEFLCVSVVNVFPYKAYKYVFSKISWSLESHLDSWANYLQGDPLDD